jgi:hypothetical protein
MEEIGREGGIDRLPYPWEKAEARTPQGVKKRSKPD